MRFTDIFKLSTRMFKARTSRTLLTVTGMGIGIAAILFLVSLGYGLQKTLLERITTSESLLTLDVTEAKSGVVSLDSEMIKKIEAMEGVEEVSPAFQLTAQGHMEELSADLVVISVNPSFLRLGGFRIEQGKSLTDENGEGVVINSAVSQVFGKDVNEMIGKKIKFTFFVPQQEGSAEDSVQSNFKEVKSETEYEVIGIVKGEGNIVYVNSASLRGVEVDKYDQAKVKSQSSDKMAQARDKILENGLLVSSLSDTVDQANKIFQVIQIILMLFGIIALVVSAIGMFNTMTIALLERTEEIGIMKSIGATDMAISLMFIMESTVMGFLGGLVGIAMGLLGGKLLDRKSTRLNSSHIPLSRMPSSA